MLALLAAVAQFAIGGRDMYSWRTRDDGVIVVTDSVDDQEKILTLSGPNAELMESVEARWGDICRRIGARYGLRDGWLQAMIWRESGGNPSARNPEVQPGTEDDGVGLMQITNASLKSGHTDAELQDPEVNVEIGAAFVALLVRRYGQDFPSIAAAFNAGSVRRPSRGFENPWNMHAARGHITAEVSALNYYLQRPLSDSDRASVLAVVHATLEDCIRHDIGQAATSRPPIG